MDPASDSFAPKADAGGGALAPCGPECRYARRMTDPASDYIWCRRLGTVRLTGPGATECRWFDPGKETSGGESGNSISPQSH